MADDKDILKKFEKLKDNSQFSTPDGYFDSFASKVMDNIEAQEKQTKKFVIWQAIKPQLGLAASFMALSLIAYTAISLLTKDNNSNYLSEIEIVAELEADIYSLDEEDLYNLAFEDNTTESVILENLDVSEDDIIQFLMEEGTDLDLLIDDL